MLVLRHCGSTLAKTHFMTTTIEKTSDYLTTDELKRLNRYFQKEQNYQMALLIEFGFRTLLRYSDISRFTWENVLNKDELVLNEKKTGKRRSIKVGAVLKGLLVEYFELMQQPELQSTIFNYSLRHTNRLLQFGSRFVGIRKKQVSTHSLRKSGARFLYDENNRSEDVFLKISMILNHSSTQVSRRYLGITKEEILDVYAGFDFVL
jgi:integrase